MKKGIFLDLKVPCKRTEMNRPQKRASNELLKRHLEEIKEKHKKIIRGE